MTHAKEEMANYTLTIEADSYESTTEGLCTAEQFVQAMAALHGTIPAAQRQWVGLTEQERNAIEDYCEMIVGKPVFEAIEAKLKNKNAAAQPAIPDALTSADIEEHIEYVAGWNDCRAEMLKGMK